MADASGDCLAKEKLRGEGGHDKWTAPKQSQGKDNSTLNLEGVIPT